MDPRDDESARGVRLAPGVRVPPAALRFVFVASGGPGGQNVNKRSTKAVLRVAVRDLNLPEDAGERLRASAPHWLTREDELVIACESTRSQHRNREACLEMLGEAVRRAMVRPKSRRPTRPSRGSVERRLGSKKQRSDLKRSRRNPEP